MINTYSYRYKNYQSKTIQQHMTRAKTNTKHKDINIAALVKACLLKPYQFAEIIPAPFPFTYND